MPADNVLATKSSESSSTIKNTLGLLPLLALSAALTTPAFAQSTTPPAETTSQNAGGETAIEQVNVEGGAGSPNTLNAETDLGRLPGTIQDTPQTVNVVTQEVMQQQKTQTLEQVLRNVPGVTMAIGEGNGGLNGDQFKIRGFEAKGNIYSDGLRDFGVYVRDSFAYESVDVYKGPTSESFGMGTTGGAINTEFKKARLGDEIYIEGQGGNGPLGRVMVDVNKQLNETSALRFVALGHWQDLVDRDNNFSDRAGFFGTGSFGIGTDLTWDISYYYQHGDRTPDYGVPMIANGTASPDNPSLPITEFGVPRSSYYGKEMDHDIFNAHMVTSKVKWEAEEWLTLYNDTRVAYYDRDFSTSVPGCSDPCPTTFFAGEPTTLSSYGGGNPTYTQESWGIQNVTTGVAKFETGALKHEVVFGMDAFYEHNEREYYSVEGKDAALVDIRNPGATYDLPYTVTRNPDNDRGGHSSDFALFGSERLWVTPEISVLGGVRWDYFSSEWQQTVSSGGDVSKDDTGVFSPKASLIWEPTPDQSYYVSWARSFTPAGQFISNSANAISATQLDLEPEESDLLEAGAKVSLLDGRLGATAAVFQIEKSNAYYTDSETQEVLPTGEEQRVRGFELGLTGKATDAWTITVAYSHLTSEVLTSTTDTNIGNEVAYVPTNAISVWTSYEVSKHLDIEGKLDVGGGFVYSSEYYTNSQNTGLIPETFSLDAFIAYEYKNMKFALNGYNLTDELNYSTGWSNRAVVAPGRSFIFTVGTKF